MPVSAKSLARRGLISDRVMKLYASKSHSQPSKMAAFDAKSRDEGKDGNKGVLPTRQINSPATQDKGGTWGTKGRGPPTKGARAGAEGQFGVNEIGNKGRQHPKFPKAGSKAKGKYTKPAAVKGTRSQSTGVVYNAPSRN